LSHLLQHHEYDPHRESLEVEDPLLQLPALPVQHDEARYLLRGRTRTPHQGHALQGKVSEVPIAVDIREDARAVQV
jgi:hypothetical protein